MLIAPRVTGFEWMISYHVCYVSVCQRRVSTNSYLANIRRGVLPASINGDVRRMMARHR